MQIRYRNIVRDNHNIILSGSAALVENRYTPNANGNRLQNHSKQRVVERLGRVVWMDDTDKGKGIFISPSRGLVFYDLGKDEFLQIDSSDTRLLGTPYHASVERIHTNFGNAFLFFSEMEKTPFMRILRNAFNNQMLYEKVLAHLAHDCLKNGSAIKCGEFLKGSFLSYILSDIPISILDCDSPYFAALADDTVKVAFFRNLVLEMRKTSPEFGRCCYTDSTPLPGEAENNPFNALSSHGTDGAVIQARLVLVLDIQTSIPVWFEIIPSNVLDKSTILSITHDVKATLNVDIEVYDLDAGYARKELFEMFNKNNNTVVDDENGRIRNRTLLIRMPATNGYPHDELYIRCKPRIYSGRYSFDYEHHTFFGERIEVDLFGYPEYAFVYVDKTQAEKLLRGWREQHLEEWENLSDLAQDWYQVKDGFFILVGNKEQTPKETLIEYRGRTDIEGFFRNGKTYLKILPLAKWNKQTVTGKIFHDIMEIIFYRSYRKAVAPTDMPMSSLIVCMDSLEACKISDNLLEIKTPNTQAREVFEKLGYTVVAHLDLMAFRDQILKGIPMTQEPVTMRSKRNRKTVSPAISPEEKQEEKKHAQLDRMLAKSKKKMEQAIRKADKEYAKAEADAKHSKQKAIIKAEKELKKVETEAKRSHTIAKAKERYKDIVVQINNVYEKAISVAKDILNKAKSEASAEYDQAVKSSKQILNLA